MPSITRSFLPTRFCVIFVSFVSFVSFVLAPRVAWACPVCFGGDDPVVRDSLTAGIGVLLGVTAVVLGLFVRFFVRLARRSRESAHLVQDRFEPTVQ